MSKRPRPASNGVIEIVPTNTCPPDLAELSRRSAFFADFSEWVQLDISDGLFTQERSWPYGEGQWAELESLADGSLQPPFVRDINYETHMMVEEPGELGLRLAQAGIQRIIGHVEAFADEKEILEALGAWRSAGAREVGLAILLDTPLPVLEPMIPACDVVQVMSIATLGKQGAPYDIRAIARIGELHSKYPTLTISVDGGVSMKNIAELTRAGARRFGVGSAITKAENPKVAYEQLKSLAESALE
ncbi:hypothetical protein HY971_01960 [Candidatus Kaiserbacteria bacterium]|nr:hypothetical protein [Candidatus Kaiserbacteria bacterium]